MHDFHVFSKAKLKRADVIKALQDKKFSDWLGNAMPNTGWEDLVPKSFTEDGTALDTKAFTMTIPGRQQKGTFKAKFEAGPLYTDNVLISQTDKPDDATMRDKLSESWKRLPAYSDPDWPLWKRLGFDTFDDLIALFSFEIDKGKSKPGAWNVHGVAYSYEVRTPLIDKDTLYCNYFPVGEADDRNVMTMTVDYNDTRVFGQANFIPKHFADKI